jgi:hypothetical protein
VIERGEIDNPHSPASVRAAAQHHGVSAGDYQIIMAIDINPKEAAGGLSIFTESVYVGNYGHWKIPLDSQKWMQVAATAYHHEMAHHWGGPMTGSKAAAGAHRNMRRSSRRAFCLVGRTSMAIMCRKS